jgi:hypothetical protein
MGRRKSPVDEFFSGVNRLIIGLNSEIVKRLRDFVQWFFVQGVLDTFLSPYHLGFAVDAFFLLFTGYGLFADVEDARSAKSLIRFILAVFGLVFDIWLNVNIH